MEAHNPGTLPVIEDFAIFLTYLHSKKIPATLQQAHLKQKDLIQLNQELHHQASWVTEKSLQPAYPELEFFYEVGLASGILRILPEKDLPFLSIDEEKLARYQDLSTTDQYFFLLETAWRYLNWEPITTSPPIHFQMVMSSFIEFLANQQPNKALDVKNLKVNRGSPGYFFSFDLFNKVVQIFSFLGFCTLEADKTLTKKPDKYTAPFRYLTVTPLGTRLASILHRKFPFDEWNILTRKQLEEDAKMGKLLFSKPQLEASEPEGIDELPDKQDLQAFLENIPQAAGIELPVQTFYIDVKTFKPGNYDLEVSLAKDLYRIIRLSSRHTLTDLHQAIQEAFKFANDHLYAFFLNNGLWSEETFYDPESLNDSTTDQVSIGDLDLWVGQRFQYIFDFGDHWEFVIDVLAITETGEEVTEPQVLEKVGRAPKQY